MAKSTTAEFAQAGLSRRSPRMSKSWYDRTGSSQIGLYIAVAVADIPSAIARLGM